MEKGGKEFMIFRTNYKFRLRHQIKLKTDTFKITTISLVLFYQHITKIILFYRFKMANKFPDVLKKITKAYDLKS